MITKLLITVVTLSSGVLSFGTTKKQFATQHNTSVVLSGTSLTSSTVFAFKQQDNRDYDSIMYQTKSRKRRAIDPWDIYVIGKFSWNTVRSIYSHCVKHSIVKSCKQAFNDVMIDLGWTVLSVLTFPALKKFGFKKFVNNWQKFVKRLSQLWEFSRAHTCSSKC